MWRCFSLFLALALTACSTVARVDDSKVDRQLAFLRVGQVTRSEVIQRLGKPNKSYEGERIVSYRITESDDQVNYYSPQFCLMLVYAENDVLVRRSLISLQR
jgi:hypothetical protein